MRGCSKEDLSWVWGALTGGVEGSKRRGGSCEDALTVSQGLHPEAEQDFRALLARKRFCDIISSDLLHCLKAH